LSFLSRQRKYRRGSIGYLSSGDVHRPMLAGPARRSAKGLDCISGFSFSFNLPQAVNCSEIFRTLSRWVGGYCSFISPSIAFLIFKTFWSGVPGFRNYGLRVFVEAFEEWVDKGRMMRPENAKRLTTTWVSLVAEPMASFSEYTIEKIRSLHGNKGSRKGWHIIYI